MPTFFILQALHYFDNVYAINVCFNVLLFSFQIFLPSSILMNLSCIQHKISGGTLKNEFIFSLPKKSLKILFSFFTAIFECRRSQFLQKSDKNFWRKTEKFGYKREKSKSGSNSHPNSNDESIRNENGLL